MKATLFQIMCQINSFDNLYKWNDAISKNTAITDITCNPPGSLGTKLTFKQLQEAKLLDICIGTISLKFTCEEKKISVLIFPKSGKMRISGGFPKQIIEGRDKNMYDDYIKMLIQKIPENLNIMIITYGIKCINGQFSMCKFNNYTDLKCFLDIHRDKFFKVKLPSINVPGRRGAFRCYLNAIHKTHISIDTGGKVQIFAAKTFSELFRIFEIFC